MTEQAGRGFSGPNVSKIEPRWELKQGQQFRRAGRGTRSLEEENRNGLGEFGPRRPWEPLLTCQPRPAKLNNGGVWAPMRLSSFQCLQTPSHGPTGTWSRVLPALPRGLDLRQSLRSQIPGMGRHPPPTPGHHRAAAGCQGGAGRWESCCCQSGRYLSKLGWWVGPGDSSAES